MKKNYIAYCRVSTKKQGLGLEAQMQMITDYVQRNGGTILATFQEKESGAYLNRPQLAAAVDAAKRNKADIIVAKLDRLSRDVADVFNLKKMGQKRGIDFVVCDINAADTMLLGIFATLAQKERELISQRTKAAFAAHKEKHGDKSTWGHRKGESEQGKRVAVLGQAARKEIANNADENLRAWHAIRLMGGTLQSKADWLNGNGYRTRNGSDFKPTTIRRLLARYQD